MYLAYTYSTSYKSAFLDFLFEQMFDFSCFNQLLLE